MGPPLRRSPETLKCSPPPPQCVSLSESPTRPPLKVEMRREIFLESSDNSPRREWLDTETLPPSPNMVKVTEKSTPTWSTTPVSTPPPLVNGNDPDFIFEMISYFILPPKRNLD